MLIVETINSDLKDDGVLLEIKIEKPSDYKSYAKKWGIYLEADTYELFLASKINDYVPKRAYVEGLHRGLNDLKIPTNVPLKLSLYKEHRSTFFLVQLITQIAEVDTYFGEMPF